MKKGHRRTNSQTLGASRPFTSNFEKPIQRQYNPFQFNYCKQKEVTKYTSIQSLLQKSQTNIAKRIQYIQNLEQPNTLQDCKNQFSFGKGLNYKLSSFKLNMGQILQVPKSNQSTSLHGENKLEILEKQTFFSFETNHNNTLKNSRQQKQLSKAIKFYPKHAKTSSAVCIKKISKFQKSQKPQPKHQIKNVAQNNLKDNPLKRPKLEYTLQKKNNHFGKYFIEGNNGAKQLQKQAYLDSLSNNENKKKNKSHFS